MNYRGKKVLAVALVALLEGLLVVFSFPIEGIQLEHPVDVAVTDVTNVDGMLIYFCGTNKTSGTNIPINMTLERLDANPQIEVLLVHYTLNRMNVATSENVTVNSTQIILSAGGAFGGSLLWNETLSTLSAGTYDIYGFAEVISPGAYDTNMTNNIKIAGRVEVLVAKEDLNRDGWVDVFDEIILSGHYGESGPPGWIPEDLMPDGVIDRFDALMIARMIGWNITNPIPPKAVAWILTISTPPGQNVNDSIQVFSDYIVYSTYDFNKTLKQLSFNITSSIDGSCNLTIPMTSMSGAFTVYLNDALTPCITTWNTTHYFLDFNTTVLSGKVRIVSQYADQITGDLNHDRTVDIFDAILLSNHYGEEDP